MERTDLGIIILRTLSPNVRLTFDALFWFRSPSAATPFFGALCRVTAALEGLSAPPMTQRCWVGVSLLFVRFRLMHQERR